MLAVEHLSVHLPAERRLLAPSEIVHALDDVTLSIETGEALGVVGESGCGKSTLIRTVARLLEPTSGRIVFEGRDITKASRRALQPVRRKMQVVFQNPEGSLNPRRRVGQMLATPLRLRGVPRSERGREIAQLLALVGLSADHARRHPHELSGGQRQRVGIARALAMKPSLLLLDEPVSALDVSVQAQIVNLLGELRRGTLAMLFVAHDLAVVRQVSDRIAVMYLGKIVEIGPAEVICRRPIHPYTAGLLASVPRPDPRASRRAAGIGGEPASATTPPPGCRFHPRCPHASELCAVAEPPLVQYPGGRLAACHHPLGVENRDLAAARIAAASPVSAVTRLPTPR